MRFLLLISFCLGIASAQEPALRSQPMVQIGVGFGGVTYIGDHNFQKESYYRVNAGFNISAQFDNYKRISPQINLGLGQFRGQDPNLKAVEGVQPNTYFNTRYLFVSLMLRYRFNKLGKLRPHLATGLSILNFTPEDEEGNNLSNKLDTRNEDETYGSTAIMLPLNVGVTYKVNELISIGLDFTYYLPNTDFLDNVAALGERAGNDKLQALIGTVYFTPSQKDRQGRR